MSTQPQLVSVRCSPTTAGQILVTWNTNVNSTDATTTGYYTIPGLGISGATYANPVTTLTVTGLVFGTGYILTVTSVRDVTNTYTVASPYDTLSFLRGSGFGRAPTVPATQAYYRGKLQRLRATFSAPTYQIISTTLHPHRVFDATLQPFAPTSGETSGGTSTGGRSHNVAFDWGIN